MDKKKKSREHDESSYSSSGGSSSSSDTVLISKPLNQKHRKQLQAQLQQQESDRQAAADESAAARVTTTTITNERANGKGELICLVCETEGDLILCTGPCVSAFHLKCLGIDSEPSVRDGWKCPSCTSGTHVCFHCKRLGVSVNPDAGANAGAGTATSVQTPTTANPEGLRPVRKCRALSCGKFYHSDCIAKLPLARIAGSNFICPLHTCAACEQSGAKKESVRCMRCPVAYHTSCLPKNCAQNFPGKRIICPKHEGSSGSSQTAASALEVSSSSRSSAETAPIKDKKSLKEGKSSKHHGSEHGEKDKARASSDRPSTTEDDKTEGGDDVKNEDSGAVSNSTKKLSKSAKREKKKKKKKRKKQKKHESKSRGHGDDDEEGEDEFTGAKRTVSRTDSDDDDDEDENESASNVEVDVKREGPYDLPALSVTFPDAVSPATSSSLFESPATTNERIKARLVEALGQSDDDVESLSSSPIALPTPKIAKVDSEEVRNGENETLRGSPERAVGTPAAAHHTQANVKHEVSSLLPASSMQPDVKESAPPSILTSKAPVATYESSHSVSGYASNSQSSGEKLSIKGERKVEKEHAASMDGKDLSRQLNESASDRKSSKKQTHGYSGLSLQIPGSPDVNSPGGVGHLDTAGKDGSVSEGEEGDDEGPGGSSTPTLRRRASTGGSGTPRGETAGDLKGKAMSSARVSKKKKKKKTKSSAENSADATRGEQQDGLAGEGTVNPEEKDEAKWVQCDSCKKWRTVPKNIDLNLMPERWYCKMNTWDSVYASCAVAEEIVNATSKKPKSGSHAKKSKSKSRAKPQPDTQEVLAAGTGGVSDGGASSPSSGSGSHTSKKASSEPEGSAAAVGGEQGKLTKKQEKQAKKRKLKLKLKEKYREVKWVQCESAQCGKWRVVPSSIDFNLLPTVWYCHLNTWTPEVAKCSAPNPPEVEAYLMKSHSKKGNSSSSSGSRPSKKLKPSSEASVSMPMTSAQAVPGVIAVAGGDSEVLVKPSKPAKAPKSAAPSTPAASHPGANNGAPDAGFPSTATNSVSSTNLQSDAASGAGVGSSAQPISHNPLGVSNNTVGGGKGRKVKPDGIKKTVLEWAQCEKCNKWRKLPQHIKSSTLPDKWYCTMNHWDPVRASCSIPEEVDQEPVGASPLPSSQNWYPMPGQVSGNGASGTGGGMRSKRSKLSYTELLYASTGQLRKTYTSESSTLTFEHGGRTYQRDDQYKDSSMYVSPDSLPNTRHTLKQTGVNTAETTSANDSSKQTATSGMVATAADELASDKLLFGDLAMPSQPSVEQVATLVLDSMDVRRSSTIVELFRAVNDKGDKDSSREREGHSEVDLSLSLVTAAVSHLVQNGLIEKQDGEHEDDEQVQEDDEDTAAAVRVGSKRRKASEALFSSSTSATLQYRKVPKRPLKASKCWRLGQSAFEFPLKE